MIVIKPTKDVKVITTLMKEPSIYEAMKGPGFPSLNDFEPNMDKNHLWGKIRYQGETIGLLIGEYLGEDLWEGHIGILPEYQKKGLALEAVQQGTNYLMEEKGALRVVSAVPSERKDVVGLLQKLGWGFLGVWYKDGLRIVMGIDNGRKFKRSK